MDDLRGTDRSARLGLAFVGLVAASLAATGCEEPKVPDAWGLGFHTFDAHQLGLVDDTPAESHAFLAGMTNRDHLIIPTYEGSNQVVHPDVMVDPNDPTRLLMAITPYPYSDARSENPSLFESSDGVAFHPLVHNPMVPPPKIDHNDDPDIRWDTQNHEYEILYLDTEQPTKQTLRALRSPDGLAWTAAPGDPVITWNLTNGDDFIVSPTVVFDGTQSWMFYVDLSAAEFSQRLEFLTSADGKTWDYSKKQSVNIQLGDVTPWHIDVVKGPAGYALLISGYTEEFGHQNLYTATSKDLLTWTMQSDPLLAYTDPSLGIESMYRSTGLVDGDQLLVWYSMKYHHHGKINDWAFSDDHHGGDDHMPSHPH